MVESFSGTAPARAPAGFRLVRSRQRFKRSSSTGVTHFGLSQHGRYQVLLVDQDGRTVAEIRDRSDQDRIVEIPGLPEGDVVALESVLEIVRGVTSGFGAGLLDRESDPVSSDISHLGRAGVPTLEIAADTRTYFDHHHTAADTSDKIVPEELAENAAAMAVLAHALATLDY